MPYGQSSFYNVDVLTKAVNNSDTGKSEVFFQENFDGYDSDFSTDKWLVKRSSNIDGTDIGDASNPKWFLCKPTNFSGNGATYINSGTRSAAIAYTAQNFTWLITKQSIDINSDDTELSFWIYFYNNASQNIFTYFHVLVNDGSTWNLLRSWDNQSPNNLYQQRVSIGLESFVGKSIQVAFVYENKNNEGYQLAIDDITIGTVNTPILTLSAIPYNFSYVPLVLVDFVDLSLGVEIANSGLMFTDTATLQASVINPNEISSYSQLLITDTINEGSSKIYYLADTTDYDLQGEYVIIYQMWGDNIDYFIPNDTASFWVSNNIFATDYGVTGGFSLGQGNHIGNLYPIRNAVVASGIQIGWSTFSGGANPIPFGLEIFEINPIDSSLSSIYYQELERLPDHNDQYTTYVIENTYLTPGAYYFVAIKQLTTTPIGVGFDMQSSGHFWSLDNQGNLVRFANPSFGNLAIRLVISAPSNNNYLNLTVTDGENPVEGAVVQIDENDDLLTNAEGKVTVNLENGIYIYRVSKDGYAEVLDTVKINFASANRTVVLKPEYLVKFTLSTAKSPVAGAEILVSGKSTITNDDGIAELYLTAGVHKLTALRTGYLPIVQDIEVTESGNEFDIEMEAGSTYSVLFNLVDELENPLENAKVSIDNIGFKFSNSLGEISFEGLTPANDISYSIYKFGFQSISKTFSITNSDIVVNDTLKYVKYTVVFEVNNGEIPLNNAVITLEGYPEVTTNLSGLTQVSEVIPSDSISFTVFKMGYHAYTSYISIFDTNVRKVVTLEINTSSPLDNVELIRVYPNPSNGLFTVEAENMINIQVFDMTGRVVHTYKTESSKTLVDISCYPKGLYIVKVFTKDGYKALKIVKQ